MRATELLPELSLSTNLHSMHERGILLAYYKGKETYANLDEARYNLATRIMSNGVEVIIASDKGKPGTTFGQKSSFLRIMPNGVAYKPLTLAPSTLKGHMILVMPSNTQENFTISINTHQFVTKTCLTTYTYRTTYLENGHTTVESHEKVVANIATNEQNYLKINPVHSLGVTLTRTPELAVGLFSTTYSYYNTIFDSELPLVLTSKHTIINTVTGPDDYISFLQQSEATTTVLDTNTYYTCITLTRTVIDDSVQKILTTTNVLTQVIITESQPPQSTLLLTSYFAYDTDDTLYQGLGSGVLDIKPTSSTHYAENLQSIQILDEIYDMHIYATKTFVTTVTYYTTSLLSNKDFKINLESTESRTSFDTNIVTYSTAPLLQTVVNYHTRFIENIITETIPSSILRPDFISQIRSELQKTGKYQHRVIVTTVTLNGDHTLEVTAVNILKPNSLSSNNIFNEVSEQYGNETINEDIKSKIDNSIFKKQHTTSIVTVENIYTNILDSLSDVELASSEADEVYVSVPPPPPLKDIDNGSNTSLSKKYSSTRLKSIATKKSTAIYSIAVVNSLNATIEKSPTLKVPPPTVQQQQQQQTQPQKQNVKISNKNDKLKNNFKPISVTQQPVSVNQLFGSFNLNRLHALGPVFNAMAGLLQSNFYKEQSNVVSPSPASASTASYVTKSKNAPKNISIGNFDKNNNNNTATNKIQHIYIPVQNGLDLLQEDFLGGAESNTNLIGLDALSPPQPLHIQPPQAELAINYDNWLQETSSNPNYYSGNQKQGPLEETIVTTGVQQISLLNSGIPIRPGEVITANSDIIIGKPNGIQVPRFPTQHPLQLQIDADVSPTLLREGEIPAMINVNYVLQPPPPSYSLHSAPSTGVTYYKHFIQHPPPPTLKKKSKNQSHIIPLLEQPEYELHPETTHMSFNGLRRRPPRPLSLPAVAHTTKHTTFGSFYLQPPPLPVLTPDVPLRSQQNRNKVNLQNIHILNTELQYNEVLEIKRIPQVYSTDVPSISDTRVEQQQQQQLYYQSHSNHQHISLDTHVLNHNVDINVPPLTFNKEIDYPQVEAVHGQIPSVDEEHKANNAENMLLYMSHEKIPPYEAHVQVKMTPQNVLGSTNATPILKLSQTSPSHNMNKNIQQQYLRPFQQTLQVSVSVPPIMPGTAIGAFAMTQKSILQLSNKHQQQELTQQNQANDFHHALPPLSTQTTTTDTDNGYITAMQVNQWSVGDETTEKLKFNDNRWHNLAAEDIISDIVAFSKQDEIDKLSSNLDKSNVETNYVTSYLNDDDGSSNSLKSDYKIHHQGIKNNLKNIETLIDLNAIADSKASMNAYSDSSSAASNAKNSESSIQAQSQREPTIDRYTQQQINFTSKLPTTLHMTTKSKTTQPPMQLKPSDEEQFSKKSNNYKIIGSPFRTPINDQNYNDKEKTRPQSNTPNHNQELEYIFVSKGAGFNFSLPLKKSELFENYSTAIIHSKPTGLLQTTSAGTVGGAFDLSKANRLENSYSLNRPSRPHAQIEQQLADEIFVSFETTHPHNYGAINETLKLKKISKTPTIISTLPLKTKPLFTSIYKEKRIQEQQQQKQQQQKIETPALNIRPPPLSASSTKFSTESVFGLSPLPQLPYTSVLKTLSRDSLPTSTTLIRTTPYKTVNITTSKWYSLLPQEHKNNHKFILPPPLPSYQPIKKFSAAITVSPIQKQQKNTTTIQESATASTTKYQQQQFKHDAYVNLFKRKQPTITMLPPPSQQLANAINTKTDIMNTQITGSPSNIADNNHYYKHDKNQFNNRLALILTTSTTLIKSRISTTTNIINKGTIITNTAFVQQHKQEAQTQKEQKEQEECKQQTHLQYDIIVKPTKSISIHNHSIQYNTIHEKQQQVNISTAFASVNYENDNHNENSSQWLQKHNTIRLEPSVLHLNVIDFNDDVQQPMNIITQPYASTTSKFHDKENILYKNDYQQEQQNKSNSTEQQIILPTKFITNTKILIVTTTETTVLTTSTNDMDNSAALLTPTKKKFLLTKTQTLLIVDSMIQIHTLLQPANVAASEIITTTQTITKPKTLMTASIETSVNFLDSVGMSSTTINNNHNHKLQNGIKYNSHNNHFRNDSNRNGNSAGNFSHATIKVVLSNVLDDKSKKQKQQQITATTESNSILIVMTNGNNHNHDINNNKYINYNTGSKSITYGKIDGVIKDDVNLPARDEDLYDQLDLRDNANRVLLGGVLIETPSKPREPQQQAGIHLQQCQLMCKSSRNELCALVESRQRCVCRPGFARMFPDRPCKPTYTYALSILAYSIGHYTLHYDPQLANNASSDFRHLTDITHNAVDRMVMQSDFRDLYHGVYLTSFKSLDNVSITNNSKSNTYVMANLLLQLSDNSDEKRLENVFKKYLQLSNYSIGGTELYTSKKGVDWLSVVDFNECAHSAFHDCSLNAHCFNLQGTYTCSCEEGFADLSENAIYPGRVCSTEFIGCNKCNYHGKCLNIQSLLKVDTTAISHTKLTQNSTEHVVCECFSWYTGVRCQLNLKILLIVLIVVGTLLSMLLLFCILLTCKKRRRKSPQLTSGIGLDVGALDFGVGVKMPTSVSSQSALAGMSSKPIAKNSRLASVTTKMRTTTVLKRNKSTNIAKNGSVNMDKREIIKDSSSDASHNSVAYVLKRENQKEYLSIKSRKYSLNTVANSSAISSYDALLVNTNISIGQSLLPTNTFTQSLNEVEQHFPEQTDRSLTVMIPRAKYHPFLLSQSQLLRHQLPMERTDNQEKRNDVNWPNLQDNVTELSMQQHYVKKYSISSKSNGHQQNSLSLMSMPNNSALVSAGFEVSAIVSEDVLSSGANSAQIMETANVLAVPLLTQSDNISSSGTNVSTGVTVLNNKDVSANIINNNNIKELAKQQQNDTEYNSVYCCDKTLIDTMDVWLNNVQQNELSGEARSFDETTVKAATKSLQICFDNQTQDEANTMTERDIGSTFLLPHTHLYKPERLSLNN